MNKLIIILFFLLISIGVYASPRLVSDPSTDLTVGAVFQIMINDIEQPEIYPVVDNAVSLDVQNFEGQMTIKIRYGNPWPDLADTYKWSDWSEPFVYNFPIKPVKPGGCSIRK